VALNQAYQPINQSIIFKIIEEYFDILLGVETIMALTPKNKQS